MSMMMKTLKDAPVVPMLPTSDLARARSFWRDTIGLTERQYDERQRGATYEAGKGTMFAIYERDHGSTADHTQLSFGVEDFDGTIQALKGQGVRLEDYDLPNVKTVNGIADMGDGAKAAWFKDPDANIIGVFSGEWIK